MNKKISSSEFKPTYIDFMGRVIAEKGIYKFLYLRLNLLKYYPNIANQYKFRIITPQSDINSISDSEIEYKAIKKIKALMNAKYRISKLSGCILVT